MKQITDQVEEAEAGVRLDRYLARSNADISRSEFQRAIRAGRVSVNGQVVEQTAYRVQPGELIQCTLLPAPVLEPIEMDLSILHEDGQLIVVDKPSGLVVHPGAGHHDPTLIEALLFNRDLPPGSEPRRPGIVHRLDKETSGAIVVAKTTQALTSLQSQFAARKVEKTYLAVVEGNLMEEEGAIDAPLGRDPAHPTRMGVRPKGRNAVTTFHVLARYADESLILASPHTGRTHQVRVHFQYTGHPIVGDGVYGREGRHLMLHAWRLAFTHPKTGQWVRFEAPVPTAFPSYPYGEIPWREARRGDSPTPRHS